MKVQKVSVTVLGESDSAVSVSEDLTRQQIISRPEGGSDIQMQLERKMARVIIRIQGFGSQYDDDEKTVEDVRIYSQASGEVPQQENDVPPSEPIQGTISFA